LVNQGLIAVLGGAKEKCIVALIWPGVNDSISQLSVVSGPLQKMRQLIQR